MTIFNNLKFTKYFCLMLSVLVYYLSNSIDLAFYPFLAFISLEFNT